MTATRPRPPRPLQPHGTTARAQGRKTTGIPPCDCSPCMEAIRVYKMRRRKLRELGHPALVGAAASVRHMELLVEAGMTWAELRAVSGIGSGTIKALRRPGAESSTIMLSTQTRVLAVPVPVRGSRRPGAWLVDGIGTLRRRRALARQGWSSPALAPHTLINARYLRDLQHCGVVTVATRARMIELFELLKDTPGPSVQVAKRAERNDWLPPEAWVGVDIDDPAATPVDLREAAKRTAREVAVEAAHLRTGGASDEQIAARLGMSKRDLHIYLGRARKYAAAEAPVDDWHLEEVAP